MTTIREQNRSLWLADAPWVEYAPLRQQISADVAVIGGGITGLTTALLLQKAGLQVVVLEADRIGCGTTGGSTAKVTALQSTIYSQLEKRLGSAAARVYAEANRAGVEKVVSLAEELGTLGTDCQLQLQPAFTYTCDPDRVDAIREEAEAAERAGLPVRTAVDSLLAPRRVAPTESPWSSTAPPRAACTSTSRRRRVRFDR